MNISNSRGSISFEMPIPVSEMVMATRRLSTAGTVATAQRIFPCGGVNFAALCSTLVRICTKRVESTSTAYPSCGMSTVSSISDFSMAGRCASTAACISSVSDVGVRWSTIFPDVILDTSSRSSISRTICPI
jgi:hypothetical protein